MAGTLFVMELKLKLPELNHPEEIYVNYQLTNKL